MKPSLNHRRIVRFTFLLLALAVPAKIVSAQPPVVAYSGDDVLRVVCDSCDPVLEQSRAAYPVAIAGNNPVVVVLCNFSDNTQQPNPPSYYQTMFSDAGNGQLGALDYWRDVSYSQFSVTGTSVKGWNTIAKTRDEWVAMSRGDKWKFCAESAEPGGNFGNFRGVVVVFPEAVTTSAAAIDATTTTLTVTSVTVGDAANFPTPPFLVGFDGETLKVTATSGTTWTIQRGQGGTTAKAHNAGATLQVGGDLFGFGPGAVTLNGNNYTLGGMVMAHDIGLEVAMHEEGHSFGFNHSRTVTTPEADYSDCYDNMSALSCVYGFTGAGTVFGGSSFGGTSKPSGLAAFQLDIQGWIAGGSQATFTAPGQTTYNMAALNQPQASGLLLVKVPANVQLKNSTTNAVVTTSDYYTIELRSKTGWDRGIPKDSFILHLKGQDGFGYLVNNLPTGAQLNPGDEYVDAASNVYIAINSLNSGAFQGAVTVASGKIDATQTWKGDTTRDFNDQVTLAADLTVTGSGAPVPLETVTFGLGTQSCTDATDLNGRATCSFVINQDPGSFTATATFAGNSAYNSASVNQAFTITKEESKTTYTGALTQDYHDSFTASAVLVDPIDDVPIAGKTIGFTLGVGDSCSAVTGGSGVASCTIIPTQPAGTVNIVTSFLGDIDYEPSSDTKPFVITHEETTLTYIGPSVILQGGGGVTLKAQLLEDGLVPPLPFGQTITLGLGGQTCTAPTNALGIASCTLVFTGALGPEPLSAMFAGDAYYLPSADTTRTAIVFAFPSAGIFVLGDLTVAAAGPTTNVTWWSNSWNSKNSLSGGPAPSQFKGFANTVSGLPTSSPAPSCSGTWATTAGNSPPPPATVPTYMGVIVTHRANAKNKTVSDGWDETVVVKVNPGYAPSTSGAPSPGHDGTGTIVAVFCP